MPTFDDTSYFDGFVLMVSTPAIQITVPMEASFASGRPRARRFQMQAPIRYSLANSDEWHTSVTESISHSGVLSRS